MEGQKETGVDGELAGTIRFKIDEIKKKDRTTLFGIFSNDDEPFGLAHVYTGTSTRTSPVAPQRI